METFDVVVMGYKGEDVPTITLNRWTSHAKEWAGQVVGLDSKFGLALKFCPIVKTNWSRSGKNGTTVVRLFDAGYYKVSNPRAGAYGKEAIKYYYWDGGNKMQRVSEDTVYKSFKTE